MTTPSLPPSFPHNSVAGQGFEDVRRSPVNNANAGSPIPGKMNPSASIFPSHSHSSNFNSNSNSYLDTQPAYNPAFPPLPQPQPQPTFTPRPVHHQPNPNISNHVVNYPNLPPSSLAGGIYPNVRPSPTLGQTPQVSSVQQLPVNYGHPSQPVQRLPNPMAQPSFPQPQQQQQQPVLNHQQPTQPTNYNFNGPQQPQSQPQTQFGQFSNRYPSTPIQSQPGHYPTSYPNSPQNLPQPMAQHPMQPPYQQPQPQMNNSYGHNNGHGQGDLSQGYGGQNSVNALTSQMGGLNVTQHGFNKLWGTETLDLLKTRNTLPAHGVKPPEIKFQHEYMNSINCSPDIFRCTLTKIPESKTLLQKSRLPLGILIHPYKDLTKLPVIQCATIVRCRSCRTYINPYVYFVDQRRWKCNLCFRVNELPEEFQYDPITKTCGDPSRRPEVQSATIEFLAPADYMVRPPQAAVYLFVMDVTANAVGTGYLKTVCDTLLEQLDQIPGDSRSQIGFITFDSSVHFYHLADGLSQPHQLVVCDIEDIFIPCPGDLLVSLTENRDIIRHLLTQLPTRFLNTSDNSSALGAALQAAHKLLAPLGGRITVFQSCLPTIGPGALTNRELSVKNVKELHSALNPSTDFYKKLALECSTQYIAVDLFFLNNQYIDLSSISGVAKYSGGCVYQFPNYHLTENPVQSILFEQSFQRYVVRKIGFEAVMRVRCSRGLSIHTFHGNLFVRSTDLLSLPNCNPDSAFGMQVSIDEPLNDFQTVCFQAALLYTSSKGERRIRVHTLCLPVAGNVNDIIASADQQCIIGLLAKMAVDRSMTSSLNDAREAFVNAVVDALSAYATTQNAMSHSSTLISPPGLSMLPAYTHALLRSPGFRSDLKVRLDERVHFMNQMKTLPLGFLIQSIYPDLYPLHEIEKTPLMTDCDEETPNFSLLQLCSDRIDAQGVYLLDSPNLILVYVCRNVATKFCQDVLDVNGFSALVDTYEFPELETTWSIRIRNFVSNLQSLKPHSVAVRIIREDSRERMLFVNNLVEDRGESSVSFYEFLQQLKSMVKA